MTVEEEQRSKRVTDFLVLCMSRMHSYHDHKETMAHAAMLVTLALAAAVLSTTPWPPQWVPAFPIPSKAVAFVGVAALWLFIHIYMRWQLRNRRVAAVYVAALLKVLRAWATSPPTADQLKPWDQSPTPVARIHVVLDFLIPWKGSNVTTDEGIKGYPTALVKELLRATTGATKGEAIVTYGSLLLGLLLVVRALS